MASVAADTPDWLPRRLARARAAQQAEQERQATERGCRHTRGHGETLGHTAAGEPRLYRGCLDCRAPLQGGRWLPVPDDTTGIPLGFDYRFSRPPCVRCGAFGAQLHHFAPRALFGPEEAELWPTAWLCQGCHDYWHRIINAGAGASDEPRLFGEDR